MEKICKLNLGTAFTVSVCTVFFICYTVFFNVCKVFTSQKCRRRYWL